MENYSPRKHHEAGITLIECIVSLAVIVMVGTLSVSSLAFFNRLTNGSKDQFEADATFRRIHLYIQKQIDRSDSIYVFNNCLYLIDLENSEKYMNYYKYNEENKILYRRKAYRKTLNDIGLGESSQLAKNVNAFSLNAEKNDQGEYTGLIELKFSLEDHGKERSYEAAFLYPGDPEKIQNWK